MSGVRPAQAAVTRVHPDQAPERRSPGLAALLAAVGVGAAVVALLGPLGLGVIDYHVSSGAADQVRGGDVAGVLLVGPVSLVAAWFALRGTAAASVLALAPASYGLYMYTQLAVAGDLARYGGNSERWFVLFWALVTGCGAILVVAGRHVALGDPPPARPRLERVASWYLLLVAGFLALGLHLPGLLDAWRTTPSSEEYLADPVVFWIVKLMDLGYVVPIMVAVGVGLFRGCSWARRLLAPVVGWSALLASSVAGMGLTMLTSGSPGSSAGLAAGFTVAAGVALGLAVAAYRPLLRPEALEPV